MAVRVVGGGRRLCQKREIARPIIHGQCLITLEQVQALFCFAAIKHARYDFLPGIAAFSEINDAGQIIVKQLRSVLFAELGGDVDQSGAEILALPIAQFARRPLLQLLA